MRRRGGNSNEIIRRGGRNIAREHAKPSGRRPRVQRRTWAGVPEASKCLPAWSEALGLKSARLSRIGCCSWRGRSGEARIGRSGALEKQEAAIVRRITLSCGAYPREERTRRQGSCRMVFRRRVNADKAPPTFLSKRDAAVSRSRNARHYAGIIRRGVFTSSASLARGSSRRSKLRDQRAKGGEDSQERLLLTAENDKREDKSFAFLQRSQRLRWLRVRLR